VFIVGMPRSGTTLTEQILAAHPEVFGAGELSFWADAGSKYALHAAGNPDEEGGLRALADEYLQLLDRLSPGPRRVVDKFPANFMYLGLIHAALPHARIIHMRRHPIATCLSIYFQDFQGANSYANDLEHLAHYYSEYSRVMAHWRSTLPAGVMLEVPYERLVGEPEPWIRRLVEFVRLPWDPTCLDFDQARRTIMTFSKWQARQKISSSAVNRWHKYAKFIEPLLPLVGTNSSIDVPVDELAVQR
jgi:hypothetical protein